jgi:hypothetical protein
MPTLDAICPESLDGLFPANDPEYALPAINIAPLEENPGDDALCIIFQSTQMLLFPMGTLVPVSLESVQEIGTDESLDEVLEKIIPPQKDYPFEIYGDPEKVQQDHRYSSLSKTVAKPHIEASQTVNESAELK